MLFAFTSRGFYIIDCQDSPNIIFDFAHHRFLHETGLERHFSTASQFSYDNACVCSNNKPLDWFSSLFFVCAFFHFVTNHSNNEIGILFALGNNIIFCSIGNPVHCIQIEQIKENTRPSVLQKLHRRQEEINQREQTCTKPKKRSHGMEL